MKLKRPALSQSVLLSLAVLIFPSLRGEAQTATVPARITQAVDEKDLVVLRGNVHPLARPEFDQGGVSDTTPMNRILLLLQRSQDQEKALQNLLDEQQSKSSPNYHAWLTPERFGQRFGLADADIQAVTTWLQSQGFQVTQVTKGRTVIEFSGNAGQVRNAFHTEIHRFLIDGKEYTANAADPQIPAALAPVVAGPVSLNSFPLKSFMHRLGTFQKSIATGEVKPLFTFPGCQSGNCYAVGPADFATIYNTLPLLNANPKIDGTGQTIAIVGESNINVQDVIDFRTMFGLPQNFSSGNVILDGPDPGINGSEGESDLDIQWAGAVAPGATIDFVTSAPTETTAGIVLSAIYIVDNNLAGVMSESFGDCEQRLGTLNQFHNALWEQAAAQGITVMLSAGDGGSAGCDNFDTQQTATRGLAVSGLASTPFNVAVGGTDFDDAGRQSTYWNTSPTSTTPPVPSSALSYIPEVPWNDSCARNGLNGCNSGNLLDIVAGSGGVSTIYGKPTWQSGTGVPNDQHRDLPDVSLFASNGFNGSFYIMCQRDVTGTSSCNLNNAFFSFQGVGGTSVASPAFAGIMALVNQKTGSRQGNANYVLYALAKKSGASCNSNGTTPPASTCIFYDVTKGNNSVPCTGGTLNCSSATAGINGVLVSPSSPSTPAYTATAGYDLATGLGSVNAQNLVNNWSSVNSTPSSTTLTLNNNTPVSIAHGQSVSFSVAVSPTAATGDVSLVGSPSGGRSVAVGISTLKNGTANGTTTSLPGGTSYQVSAHYEGDGTYAPSDSSPVTVTVKPEASKTLVSIPVFDPNTGRETGNTPTSLVYGSPYIARIDVGNANAVLTYPPQTVCTPPSCPTGTITWTDSLNGGAATPLDGGSLTLNIAGYAEDLPIQLPAGSHVLSASYGGDNSYSASSSTYSLTVTQAPTSSVIGQWQSAVIVGTPFQVVVGGNSQEPFGAAPTGTITFFDGATQLGAAVPVTGAPAASNSTPSYLVSGNVTLSTSGTHKLTAKYSGDTNYASSTTQPVTIQAFYATTTAVSANPATIPYGSSVTITVTVTTNVKSPAITGSIVYQEAAQVPTTIPSTTSTDSNGNTTMTAIVTATPQGPEFVNARYAGDSNFAGSSASAFIQVNIPDFSLSVPATPVVITAGQSGSVSFTVTPASNMSSPVTLSCGEPFPAGYVCGFQPPIVNLANGVASNAVLMLTVQNPASQAIKAAVVPPKHSGFMPDAMRPVGLLSGAAAFLLLVWPGQRKRLRTALGLSFVCAAILFIGCGGGGSGASQAAPATATTTTISTSAAKVAPFTQVTLTATVSGQGNPTGTVNFIYNAGSLGQSTLTNGRATLLTSFGTPGVYPVTAQYSGDSKNLPSTSTALNQAVTGSVITEVVGQTGTLSHTGIVTVTLQ